MKTFKGFEKGTSDGGFEKASKYLLEKLGYDNCKLTKATCDDGVDILATKNAVDFCVQCKNYDNKVGNDKIRDFGAAIKLYGRTNGIFMTTSSFTSEAIKTAKRLGIELWDYSHIKTLSNNLGFDLETLTPTRNRRLKSVVFEHNKPVYEQMKQMLSDYGKAIVTMGTGIGKTTTALEYCIENNCRALVVCPTNIVRDSWKNNKTNKDDRLLDTTTYQAFAKVYKDIDYNEYGVVIFDEVHHGGAETWGAGIKYLMENNIKVIGLTATEERTDGINVAEILFDNHIAEGLDILGGIREGIVYPFTYVGALYNAEQVCQAEKDKYGDKLTELLLGKLDMALNNTKNVRDIVRNNMPKGKRKGIIFSADIESMKDDIKFIKKIYPKAEIKRLHSNMSYKEQKDIKEWFSHTQSGYLCTIAMVNEGAHYEGVNTIFMLRKTTSELIFLQQLGRAITSVYGHNNPHTVVFDLVNSSKAIQNVKRKFKESGIEEPVKPVEVPEEQYDAIIEAIDNGVITPVEDIGDIIEISSEDIPVLAEAIDVKIDLEKEQEPEKVKKLTRTIYVKNKVEFNTDYGKSKQVIVKDYTRPIVEVIEELHNEFDLKPWTEEEENIIKIHYPTLGAKIKTKIPNHTLLAIMAKAEKLGVYYEGKKQWTEEEDNIIKQYYPTDGFKILEKLPNRTKYALQIRLTKLQIKQLPSWTTEDDDILCEYYPIEGENSFKRIKNHSIGECKSRVSYLKIYRDTNEWTEEEDEIIKKYFPFEGKDVYKRLTNKTDMQCYRRAKKLKIHYEAFFWTEEEDSIIIYYYPLEGPNVYKRIPNHSKNACVSRAQKLGVQKNKNHTEWDDEKLIIFKKNYPTMGVKVVELLNGISQKQCLRKAQELGIRYDKSNIPKATKQVYCVELNKIFNSITEASEYIDCRVATLSGCLNGRQHTAGGYHWKYVEE